MWRKNRSPPNGVDQNRNYDFGWDSECGGSTVPTSDTYRGPSPASEGETKLMVEFTRRRNLAKILDYHSSGREVLYNYRCEPMPSLMANHIESEADYLADYSNYATRPPSAEGGHIQWTISEISNYGFLVETESEFQPPYERALNEAARLWPQALAWFRRPIPLSGYVGDETNGQPVYASIDVAQVDWQRGETRHSGPFGRYHLNIPNGVYTISFSAPGYQTVTRSVTVNIEVNGILDISLPRI